VQGYFTCEDILAQAQVAIDILAEFNDDIEHYFVYDNATTHRKRADDALSARKMPKSMPAPIKTGKNAGQERPNFLVERTVKSSDGKPVYQPDGKLLKEKIPMTGASFSDGRPQPLYHEHGPHAGKFKGMEALLMERGYKVKGMRAECPSYNCAMDADGQYGACCMRRMLFNEPDFAGVQSLLEEHCSSQGVTVIFLPKFHCELNPIEQCWGYAKRLYRLCPESSKEEDLEANMLNSLAAIPLVCIQRYVSNYFMLYS
jgi:hypothetical protein